MEKIKKILKSKAFIGSVAAVVGAALLAVAVFALSGGFGYSDHTVPGDDVTYTMKVMSNAGKVLEGVDVFIYADNTLTDLIAVAKTDKDGVATFVAPDGVYSAVLKNAPAGYPVEESYPVINGNNRIVLKGTLIADADLTKEQFTRDDMMFDFNITDTEGNTYVLSQLLKQKKAVVLNFWFENCNPCKAEFPFLQEAYESYSDDIALIAVTPVDDAATVAQFRTEQGLTIPMASVDAAWEKAFGLTAYPTTVIIDRFGNINMVHVGSVPNAELFENMFKYYAASSYTQRYGLVLEDFAAISEEGSQANPLEFGGVMEFEVTVEPGQSIYCNVYKVSGMLLTVQDETVSILYNENTYAPENGVVTFPVEAPDTYTPVQLVFTNTGTEEKTYKATLSYPAGTQGNPYTLALGNLTVDVSAGNDQGVYYTYIAEASGELTLKCTGVTEGVDYTFTLYNLNTYVYVVLDTEENADTLTIAVNKGDEVQFTAGSLPDENNEYPAAKIDFVASFEEKEVDTPHPTEPSEPLPTDPAPTTPAPTDPKPTTPAPTDPKPTAPQPTNPQESLPAFGEYTKIYDGKIRAYHFAEGSKEVRLNAGELTYFQFTPSRAGQFRFTVTAGTLSYYGNNPHFIQDLTAYQVEDKTEQTEQSFVINIKEGSIGSSYLIGVTAPAGANSGNLEIKRIGDPVLGWEDRKYTVYNGTYTPKNITAPAGTMTYVNVGGKVSSFTPVLGDDGFYHLNSKTGPILYLNLMDGAYVEMALNTKLSGDYPFIRGYVKDANGNILFKEEYTELVKKYIACADKGLYPLTEDLVRILKTQNDNWYLYLAGEKPNTKKDLAWMCNVCYVEE